VARFEPANGLKPVPRGVLSRFSGSHLSPNGV
jgi:hypothetical protein